MAYFESKLNVKSEPFSPSSTGGDKENEIKAFVANFNISFFRDPYDYGRASTIFENEIRINVDHPDFVERVGRLGESGFDHRLQRFVGIVSCSAIMSLDVPFAKTPENLYTIATEFEHKFDREWKLISSVHSMMDAKYHSSDPYYPYSPPTMYHGHGSGPVYYSTSTPAATGADQPTRPHPHHYPYHHHHPAGPSSSNSSGRSNGGHQYGHPHYHHPSQRHPHYENAYAAQYHPAAGYGSYGYIQSTQPRRSSYTLRPSTSYRSPSRTSSFSNRSRYSHPKSISPNISPPTINPNHPKLQSRVSNKKVTRTNIDIDTIESTQEAPSNTTTPSTISNNAKVMSFEKRKLLSPTITTKRKTVTSVERVTSYERPILRRITDIEQKKANLYVSGIPNKWSEKDLRNAFAPFGDILSSKLWYASEENENNCKFNSGSGFVQFNSKIQADKAIEAMNGKRLDGMLRSLIVKFANAESQNRNMTEPCDNIYVSGLPDEIDDLRLHKLFEPFGEVESVIVLPKKSIHRKYTGFIKFKNKLDALEALKIMHRYKIPDTDHTISCSWAKKSSKPIVVNKPLYN